MAAALAQWGCSKVSNRDRLGGRSPSVDDARRPGFSEFSDPKTLNPVLNSATSDARYLDVRLLVRCATTTRLSPVPDALREDPDDRKRRREQRRPHAHIQAAYNIKWQDGVPLTCKDLEFTWQA